MINRLTEFIAQTKGISTSRWIYFDKGYSYTYDGEQLVQAITNFKEDKKVVQERVTANPGLSSREVEKRLEEFGLNELKHKKKK